MSPLILSFLVFCFFWSGFVRTAFGVGSTALMLPIALLAVPDPLIIIPIIVPQTILFCGIEVIRNRDKIAWSALGKMMVFLLPAFCAGVYGLLNFPTNLLTIAVYLITIFYALDYISPRKNKFNSEFLNAIALILGGYIGGVSFNGGPIVSAVAAKKISRELLTNSLLTIWAFFGILKVSAFLTANVDLQWRLQLLTLPAVIGGHLIGLRFHKRIVQNQKFYQWIGVILLTVSIIGIWRTL